MRLPAKPSVGPANPGIHLGKPFRVGEVLVFDCDEQIDTVGRDAIYDFCYYYTIRKHFRMITATTYSMHLRSFVTLCAKPTEILKLIITFIITALALPLQAAEAPNTLDDTSGQPFGGPSSVAGQVSSDGSDRKSPLFKDLLHFRSYDDFQESLERDHGIAYGLDYNILY